MGTKSNDGVALDAIAEAYEAGLFPEAIERAERLLDADPSSGEALHYLAASQVESGLLEAGFESYARALKAAPNDLEILRGAAEQMICLPGEDRALVEEGLRLSERGRALAKKARQAELLFEFLVLLGVGHNQLGEGTAAVKCLEEALALDATSVEARLELGVALFELCRFEEAKRELTKVLAQSSDEPSVHHYLGLLAERGGDALEAEQRFARARVLAPDEFPLPISLPEEEFDRAVEDAVSRLPEHVKGYLENTTLAVEPVPSDEDLVAESPPLSPLILGVFRGVAIGERSVSSAEDHFPASIVLYQRNLERFARSREELIEQIGITVMHEVGHLMGLDEEDLWERGLE